VKPDAFRAFLIFDPISISKTPFLAVMVLEDQIPVYQNTWTWGKKRRKNAFTSPILPFEQAFFN
jgi:hypothetical protein